MSSTDDQLLCDIATGDEMLARFVQTRGTADLDDDEDDDDGTTIETISLSNGASTLSSRQDTTKMRHNQHLDVFFLTSAVDF